MKDLSEKSRQILAYASVFTGDFSIDWILDITGFKATDVLKSLADGERMGLLSKIDFGIYRVSNSKQTEFIKNLLPVDKVLDLHHSIASIIISEVIDDPRRLKELSIHFLQISNSVEGCRWLLWAGQRMFKVFGRAITYRCYKKAIEDLRFREDKEVDELFIEAVIKFAHFIKNDYDALKYDQQLIQEALTRAESWQIKPYLGKLYLLSAINHWYLLDEDNSISLFNKGLHIVNEIGNEEYIKEINSDRIVFFFLQGHFQKVIQIYEKNVEKIEDYFDHLYGNMSTLMVGLSYSHCGQSSQGLGIINAVREHSLEIGLTQMSLVSEIYIGHILLNAGRTKDALKYYLKVKEKIKIKPEDLLMLWKAFLLNFALAYLEEENDERCREILTEVPDLEKAKPMLSFSKLSLIKLSWIQTSLNRKLNENLDFDAEIKKGLNSKNDFVRGVVLRYHALNLKRRGVELKTVMETLEKSIISLDRSGAVIESLRSRILLKNELANSNQENSIQRLNNESQFLMSHINSEFLPPDLIPLITDVQTDKYFLDIIYNFNKESSYILSNQELVKRVVLLIMQLTGAERGAVFLPNRKSETLQFDLLTSKNLPFDETTRKGFKPVLDIIERSFSTRSIKMQKDCEIYPEETHQNSVILSQVCIPAIHRGSTNGVLYFDNCLLKNSFDNFDSRFFQFFSGVVSAAIENTEAQNEIEYLRTKLQEERQYMDSEVDYEPSGNGIIGKSPSIKKVFKQVDNVASTDSTVLILGETGVGKELIAKVIHENSPRRNGPFIRVNCSALSVNLISSELFGHEKGAFTGAGGQHKGRFELANGGTIFLDEIGDIPVEVQIALLRVLQTKEFQRVGGTQTLHSDFRLLAATHQDLQKKAQTSEFREDLFYRLNVYPIVVPPLRERKDDIPLLAMHFLKLYSPKAGKQFSRVRRLEIEKLMEYEWPGNIRELENVVERGVIMSSESDFRMPKPVTAYSPLPDTKRGVSFKEMERNHLLWALNKTGWKVYGKGGAAELLDLHPNTLNSKMKRLKIDKPAKTVQPSNLNE